MSKPKDEAWTLKEIDSWEQPDLSDDIAVCLNIERYDEQGIKRLFTLRVSRNEVGNTTETLLERPLAIPLETCATRGFQDRGEPWAWSTAFESELMTTKGFVFFADEVHFLIHAAAAMSSYFREVFFSFPYLDFLAAEPECGKTTALDTVMAASYNGKMRVSPTPAVLYRTLEESKGALGIDEIDNLLKGRNSELRGLISGIMNAGYRKNLYVERCAPQTHEIQTFSPFGLKGWTRIKWIPQTFLSRAITITMMRSPKSMKEFVSYDEYREFRDAMYQLRLEKSQEVREAYNEILRTCGLTNRTRQLFAPLLTMAKLTNKADYYDNILEFAEEEEKRRASEYDQYNRWLIEILLQPAYLGYEVPIRNIRDEFNEKLIVEGELTDTGRKWTSQTITRMLRSFGLKKTGKKTGGYVHYMIKRSRVERLAREIYQIEVESYASESQLTQQTQLSQLQKVGDVGLVENVGLRKQEEDRPRTLKEQTKAVLGLFDPELANNGQVWHKDDIIAKLPELDEPIVRETVMRLIEAGLLMETAPAQYRRVA